VATKISQASIDRAVAQATSQPSPKKKAEPGRMTRRVGIPAVIAGSLGDLITTEIALSRGAREANPIMAKAGGPGRAALKAGAMVPLIIVADRARKKHPKASLAALLIAGGIQGAAAIHNTRVMAKQRR
jgi:hypothetical protein